jgi:hypothetical protein
MKTVLVALVLFLLLASPVTATVGIGLKWYTESEFVSEGEQFCRTYGIYNPFDTDVTGFLQATEGLGGIYEAEAPKLIPAGISSGEAIPTQICFNVPNVYEEESYFGFLPQKQCNEKEAILKGEVIAAYDLAGGAGTGSVTGASFAAPLRLRVRCTPMERNSTPAYFLIIVIIGALTLIYLKKRRSS